MDGIFRKVPFSDNLPNDDVARCNPAPRPQDHRTLRGMAGTMSTWQRDRSESRKTFRGSHAEQCNPACRVG